MSHINVTINGRQYRMACEEGQEVRLLKLAEQLETRIQSLRGKFGEIGDARLTVMAALTVCDELIDANQRIQRRHQPPRRRVEIGGGGLRWSGSIGWMITHARRRRTQPHRRLNLQKA